MKPGSVFSSPCLLTSGNGRITNDQLGCDIETLPTAADRAALDPGWRVGVVEAHRAREWATVMMPTFGFTTPDVIEMAEASAPSRGVICIVPAMCPTLIP